MQAGDRVLTGQIPAWMDSGMRGQMEGWTGGRQAAFPEKNQASEIRETHGILSAQDSAACPPPGSPFRALSHAARLP